MDLSVFVIKFMFDIMNQVLKYSLFVFIVKSLCKIQEIRLWWEQSVTKHAHRIVKGLQGFRRAVRKVLSAAGLIIGML